MHPLHADECNKLTAKACKCKADSGSGKKVQQPNTAILHNATMVIHAAGDIEVRVSTSYKYAAA